jgi:Tfp pilus assembly protein PilF
LKAPERKDVRGWAKEAIPRFDAENMAASYGEVMSQLFLHPADRQREIESLCEGKFPGFGYAVLASFMKMDGGSFNVALTTNFDDLLSDALYIYGNAKPLVIQHESLANFIRPTHTRPLVVKLHGDHRLAPLNLTEETESLKQEIEKQVRALLYDRGLIIVGYGGHDKGIAKMLQGLSEEAFPLGVYWVGGHDPSQEMLEWLAARQAIKIDSTDFDDLMLKLQTEFSLPHPDSERFWLECQKQYHESYGRITSKSSPTDAKNRAPAFDPVARLVRAASLIEEVFPADADHLFKKAIDRSPDSATARLAYAGFLEGFPGRENDSEKVLLAAVEAKPNHIGVLYSIGRFYLETDKPELAESYYRRALVEDPGFGGALNDLAFLYAFVRKDENRAEEYFKRAVAVNPNHANVLGHYSAFLRAQRHDPKAAEEVLLRAHALEPNDVRLALQVAGHYLVTNRITKGRAELRRAKALLPDAGERLTWDRRRASTRIMFDFLKIACDSQANVGDLLQDVKAAFAAGERARPWRLEEYVDAFKIANNPNMQGLETIMRVNKGELSPESLDQLIVAARAEG